MRRALSCSSIEATNLSTFSGSSGRSYAASGSSSLDFEATVISFWMERISVPRALLLKVEHPVTSAPCASARSRKSFVRAATSSQLEGFSPGLPLTTGLTDFVSIMIGDSFAAVRVLSVDSSSGGGGGAVCVGGGGGEVSRGGGGAVDGAGGRSSSARAHCAGSAFIAFAISRKKKLLFSGSRPETTCFASTSISRLLIIETYSMMRRRHAACVVVEMRDERGVETKSAPSATRISLWGIL